MNMKYCELNLIKHSLETWCEGYEDSIECNRSEMRIPHRQCAMFYLASLH